MLTLKKTIIDLADCNTTLVHLAPQPVAGPLSFATGDAYTQLYYRLVSAQPEGDILQDGAGRIIRKLKAVYQTNKYWHRYFGMGDIQSYPSLAWEKIVPIEARLALCMEVSCSKVASVKLSLIPRLLLYPFGWSTWMSIRITGEHTLEGLADLLDHLIQDAVYKLDPGPSALQTLQQVFQHVTQGIWQDCFGGGRKRLFNPPDMLSVTTVLDKFGGAPALHALAPQQDRTLRRLVCPGNAANKSWDELTRKLSKGDDPGNLDYALQDGHGVFIWADHRLKSENRNQQHLRCYHNNTFLSLLHAWQLCVFLQQAASARNKTEAMAELVSTALQQIDDHLTPGGSSYRNVCLISFLEGTAVQKAVQKARQVFNL